MKRVADNVILTTKPQSSPSFYSSREKSPRKQPLSGFYDARVRFSLIFLEKINLSLAEADMISSREKTNRADNNLAKID